MRIAAVVLVLAACGPRYEDDSGTRAAFDPAGESFFDFPYPADHRRTPDGFVDARDVPGARAGSIVGEYSSFMATAVDGFGPGAGGYVHFSAPLDPARLPAPSAATDSMVQLVGIDPVAPDYGTRYPVALELFTQDTDYYPANTLAFMPYPGFPLRQGTTYALLVLKELGDAAGQPLGATGLLKRALAGDGDDLVDLEADVVDDFARLRDWLDDDDTAPARDELAVATVFITQHVTTELYAIRDWVVAEREPPLVTELARSAGDETTDFYCYQGSYTSPNFQQGNIPYTSSGGGFAFDDQGQPLVAFEEELQFLVAVPKGVEPAGGWPVVIYAHGTYGTRRSGLSWGSRSPIRRLTARGVAVIAIDHPLHGARKQGQGFDEGIMTYNLFNPESFRTNFRQAALDMFILARGIQAGSFNTPTGGLDGQRLGLLGFSYGAMAGLLAVDLTPAIGTSVHLSGGGLLNQQLLSESSEVLLRVGLGLELEESLTVQHPALSLAQTMIAPMDPIHVAARLVREAPAGQARNLLFSHGMDDVVIPATLCDAFATAAGLPVIAPPAWEVPGLGLRGVAAVPLPVAGNITTAAGDTVTGAVIQYGAGAPATDHEHAFRSDLATDRYVGFLVSALVDGAARIE